MDTKKLHNTICHVTLIKKLKLKFKIFLKGIYFTSTNKYDLKSYLIKSFKNRQFLKSFFLSQVKGFDQECTMEQKRLSSF